MRNKAEAAEFFDDALNLPLKQGIFLAAGGIALASAVVADGLWGKQHWPHTDSDFHDIDPSAEELSVSFGGLGISKGQHLAENARKLFPGTAGYAEYSSSYFSIPDLAEKFQQKAPHARLLHINGHSMGGPVALETQRLANHREMELGSVVLNCSPFDSDDARHKKYLGLLNFARWPAGPGNKFAFSFTKNMLDGKHFREAAQRAKYDALSGCSPKLYLSQIATLQQIDLAKHRGEYQSLVGKHTQVTYCRPEDPEKDIVVDTIQASSKYAEFCSSLGIAFKDVPIPDVSHAKSTPTFDYLALSLT